MNLQKKGLRMDISVEPTKGLIFVQQRWRYQYKLESPAVSVWTGSEKARYHSLFDRLIWQIWSQRYIVRVRGTSDFAKKYAELKFVVSMDVKWVLVYPHWTVQLTKLRKSATFFQSYVDWTNRLIALDTLDSVLTKKAGGSATLKQYGVTHEFGHTMGNIPGLYAGAHGDEYENSSQYFTDKRSIMNIGNEIRQRHIDYLLKELNMLHPNTEFYL
ncbi:MAG: hypothetical protein H7Z72_19950 [Bacteroidetes bacterium]|nr:hypothetical protein [Fibrella sp.]